MNRHMLEYFQERPDPPWAPHPSPKEFRRQQRQRRRRWIRSRGHDSPWWKCGIGVLIAEVTRDGLRAGYRSPDTQALHPPEPVQGRGDERGRLRNNVGVFANESDGVARWRYRRLALQEQPRGFLTGDRKAGASLPGANWPPDPLRRQFRRTRRARHRRFLSLKGWLIRGGAPLCSPPSVPIRIVEDIRPGRRWLAWLRRASQDEEWDGPW